MEEIIADKLQSDFVFAKAEFAENIAAWTNEDVLALAKLKLPVEQSDRMSELSDLEQRGLITNVEKSDLEMYSEIYNHANVRKAYGIAEAVKRGLISA